MESSSFSGSSKRAKAPTHTTQVVHCLVDGCNEDLSRYGDYHRRHKVCGIHSKSAKVMINGREQRFCQQCSRFHSLVEFDEGKRSCRKRLDCHNRRRRKPQPTSLCRNSGLAFAAPQVADGARLLSFRNPQILQSAVVSSSWAEVVKGEDDIMLYNHHHQQQQQNFIQRQNTYPGRSPGIYKGAMNQFQLMQGSDCSMQETSLCQPFLDPNAGSSNSGQKTYSDGLNQVVDSGRALSLLSSAPSLTQEFVLNHHSHHSEPSSQLQPLAHTLPYNGLNEYALAQDSKQIMSAADSHGSLSSTLHFPEMFQPGPEGSATSECLQTLTFKWK